VPSGSRSHLLGCGALGLLAVGLSWGTAKAQQVPPKEVPSRLDAAPPGVSTPDKTELMKKKAKRKAGFLSQLQPYRAAQRLGLRGGPELRPNDAGAAVPPPPIAAIPPPPPLRRALVEDNPYEPLGERIGNLKLTPYVEEDAGWAPNPLFVSGEAKPSPFETTEIGAALQSDWSRNHLHGQLRAGYSDYFSTPEANGPYGSGTLDGRYDVSRDLAFDGEGRFNISQEPLSALGIASAPATATNSLTTLALMARPSERRKNSAPCRSACTASTITCPTKATTRRALKSSRRTITTIGASRRARAIA
jgi:hypothetical protein